MKATRPFYLRLINDISQVDETHYELAFEDETNLRQFGVVVNADVRFSVKVPILFPQVPPVFRDVEGVKVSLSRWRPWYTIHQAILHVLGVAQMYHDDDDDGGPSTRVYQSSCALVQPGEFPSLAVWCSPDGRAVLCEAFRASTASASLCLAAAQTALDCLKNSADSSSSSSSSEYRNGAAADAFSNAHREVTRNTAADDVGVSAASVAIRNGAVHCVHLGNIQLAVIKLRGFREVAMPHHESADRSELERLSSLDVSFTKVSPSLAYVNDISEETRGLGCPVADGWMSREPSFNHYQLEDDDFAVIMGSKGLFRNIPFPEMCSILAPRRSAAEAAEELKRICVARHTGHGAAIAVIYLK